MNFEVGRCKRILEDLEKLMWSDGQTIEEFKFCDVDYFMGMDVPRAQEVEAWRDYRAGEL
jgi:hypothetical protein